MAKFLIFHNDSDDSISFPVDRLLAVDQTDSTSIIMKFEHKDGTAGSVTTVDLTVDAGSEGEALKTLMEAVASSVDVEHIWDKTSKTSSSFTAISIDSSGDNSNGLSAGAGITGGTGTVYHSWVEKNGDVIKTSIYIDLTGLRSTAAGDIIGVDGTSDACHIGQIVAATSGTIFAGTVACLETPDGGDPDINIHSATEGTGAEDTAISTLTETLLINAGDHAADAFKSLTAFPAANEFLYLTAGATTDADYTAGKLLIELYGTE